MAIRILSSKGLAAMQLKFNSQMCKIVSENNFCVNIKWSAMKFPKRPVHLSMSDTNVSAVLKSFPLTSQMTGISTKLIT